VELVISVEEAFGISISDEEACRVQTVGQLYWTVTQKVKQQRTQDCLTARAFYRLRKALIAVTGCDRRAVRPDSRVDELFPKRTRRQGWPEVAARLGMRRLPGLCLSKRLHGFLTFAVLAMAALLGYCLIAWIFPRFPNDGAYWLAILLAWAVLVLLPSAICANHFSRPYANELPAIHAGDLAKRLLQEKYSTFAAEANAANEKELWHSLLYIVAEQFGVPPTDLREGTEFVRDLGLA
jgi:hypothetical protein